MGEGKDPSEMEHKEAAADSEGESNLSGNSNPDKAERVHEADRIGGLLGRLWPVGRRFFTALGLNKCSIL